MCEQLGQVPDPAKMPLDSSAFPEEVQVAFFIFSLLSDRYEGMSGTYLGKTWSEFDPVIKVYSFPVEPKVVLYFAKMYEKHLVVYRMEEAEKKRKADERKAKSAGGGGKNYAHNVRR